MQLAPLITTTVTLLFAALSANAAGCEFTKYETDVFTKQKMVTTDWESLQSGASSAFGQLIGALSEVSVAGVREGEQQFLSLKIKLSDATHKRPSDQDLQYAIAISKDARLWIQLADKTSVELQAERSVRGKTKSKYDDGWYVVKSTLIVRYPLNAETSTLLTQQIATDLRLAAQNGRFEFVGNSGHIDFGIHKKSVTDIQSVIGCLG